VQEVPDPVVRDPTSGEGEKNENKNPTDEVGDEHREDNEGKAALCAAVRKREE